MVEKFKIEIEVFTLTRKHLNDDDLFLKDLDEICKRNKNEDGTNKIKLCLFDHISSYPACIFPLKGMIKILR